MLMWLPIGGITDPWLPSRRWTSPLAKFLVGESASYTLPDSAAYSKLFCSSSLSEFAYSAQGSISP